MRIKTSKGRKVAYSQCLRFVLLMLLMLFVFFVLFVLFVRANVSRKKKKKKFKVVLMVSSTLLPWTYVEINLKRPCKRLRDDI